MTELDTNPTAPETPKPDALPIEPLADWLGRLASAGDAYRDALNRYHALPRDAATVLATLSADAPHDIREVTLTGAATALRAALVTVFSATRVYRSVCAELTAGFDDVYHDHVVQGQCFSLSVAADQERSAHQDAGRAARLALAADVAVAAQQRTAQLRAELSATTAEAENAAALRSAANRTRIEQAIVGF